MKGEPPRRMINLWRRLLIEGEVYRSPGPAHIKESVEWGVTLAREHPLHEGPFWYFLGARERPARFVRAYDKRRGLATEHRIIEQLREDDR